MDLRSISDWFTGGSRQYHDLVHCMAHDYLWVAITVTLDVAIACGYIVIALQWRRNEQRIADGPSKRALRQLKYMFLLCGLCGYLFIPIKMFWPAWRLYDMVALALVYTTWRYAWGARGLAVVYTELGRVAQLAEELRKSRAHEAQLEGRVRELSAIERMAAALRESEERFRLLVDGVKDYAIFMLDPQGRVASWNTGAERITGYAAAEIVGRHFSCFYPEDERDACEHARVQATAPTGRFEEEGWRLRKDGSRFLADVITTTVRDPDHGTLRGFAVVVRDVSDRRRASDAIMEGEMRFARIVETAQEGIWTIDAAARTTYVNRRLAEMLGYQPEEMVGRPVHDFMDEEARAQVERNLARRRAGAREQYDFRFRRKDGSDLWTICSVSPMLDSNGGYEGGLAMVTDITDRKRAEEAVRESEAKYRTLVANIPDVTWRADATGRTTYISDNVAQAFGFTAEEVMAAGEVWLGRVHPDDLPRVLADFAALFSEGRKFDIEYRIRHKDGHWIWVHDRAHGTQTVDGVVYADGIFTDVTERKAADDALRQSEQRFDLFMRNLPGVAFMKDERGRYVYANATFEAVSGKRLAELSGKGDHECWPAEVARRFTESDRVVRARMAPLQNVEKFPHADGVHHWLSTKFPVVTDDGRTLLGGVAVDVTAAKRAEEALADKTAQLQSIADAMTAFLQDGKWRVASETLLKGAIRQTGSNYGFIGVVVNGTLRILAHHGVAWSASVNRAFYERALRTYAEVGYLEFSNFDNLFGRVITSGEAVLANDAATDPRAGGTLPAGHPPLRQFLGMPIRSGPDVVGMIGIANRPEGYGRADQDKIEILTQAAGVLYDDYRRRQREVELEAERRKAELVERERNHLKGAVTAMEQVLGVVGHELRTPIAGMRAISEFLLTEAAQETAQIEKFLTQLNAETYRMADTVDELLEAARLNSGQARWNWSTVDLAGVCGGALESVRALVEVERVRVTFEVQPPGCTMRGDADAVRRLIVNLANNARKYTDAGRIHVDVRRATADATEWVEIRVSDTGAGIPPEILAKLGEAFALNSGVVGADRVSGTGLGLAICKGIVAAHGGTLHVDSTVGRGTTVTARLRADLPGPVAGGTKGQLLLGSVGE